MSFMFLIPIWITDIVILTKIMAAFPNDQFTFKVFKYPSMYLDGPKNRWNKKIIIYSIYPPPIPVHLCIRANQLSKYFKNVSCVEKRTLEACLAGPWMAAVIYLQAI